MSTASVTRRAAARLLSAPLLAAPLLAAPLWAGSLCGSALSASPGAASPGAASPGAASPGPASPGPAPLGASAQAALRGIVEAGFTPLGGIDQWVTIRGEDLANPVLLILHGGPGEAQSPLVDLYAPWTRAFTIVQWDQRGAGRTFGALGEATPELSLPRMTADGIELAEHLRARLGVRKIALLGHSWGAYLAITMVKARPDLFSAYVGTGQPQSWRRTVQLQFSHALARARAGDDRDAVAALEAIGDPNPDDPAQYFGMLRWLRAYTDKSDLAWTNTLAERVRTAPGMAAKDFEDWRNGQGFSVNALFGALMQMDLPALGVDFDLPFFVIQGSEDWITPTQAARAYERSVRAPRKGFYKIDGAGHFAAMTSPDAFLQKLVRHVRPAAVARAGKG